MSYVKRIIKTILTYGIFFWGWVLNFHFPLKYPWSWRLHMLKGTYEPETTRFMHMSIVPGMVIIDVGAHIGYFTRLFAKAVGKQGKIYAFEGDGDNLNLLNKNTQQFENVVIVPKAVSDQDGEIIFYKVLGSTGCHSIISQSVATEQKKVPSLRLDTFAVEHGLNRVDLIKMDIEGGEPLALVGMKNVLKNNPALLLVCEYNPVALERGGVLAQTFFNSLSELGFLAYSIEKNGKLEKFTDLHISAESINIVFLNSKLHPKFFASST